MIFFFYGPNAYAAQRKLAEMAETYVKKAGSDFGLERIDGSEAKPDQIIGALQASPFLANSRLVVIRDLGKNKAASEKILTALDHVPESTVAVFYDSEVDQRTSYFKGMTKQATVKAVKFDRLAMPQLMSWVAKEVQSAGGTIDRSAAAKLVETVGDDQWRLAGEVAKLVNYDAKVSVETVGLLVEQSSNESIFDLVEAMSSGNLKSALKIYTQLLADRTNEIYVLTMVMWQLRNLLLAKTAGNMSSAELAKQAGLSPYVAGKALARQRGLSKEVLTAAFYEAIETDYAIKSGKGKADLLVEQLIYRVAASMKEGS
jgi:DNA polymerase III delta subunit